MSLDDTLALLKTKSDEEVKAVTEARGILFTPRLLEFAENARGEEKACMFLKQRGREVVRAQLRQPVPAAPSPEPVAARFQATSTNDRHERAAQGREEMNSLRAAKRNHFPVFRM